MGSSRGRVNERLVTEMECSTLDRRWYSRCIQQVTYSIHEVEDSCPINLSSPGVCPLKQVTPQASPNVFIYGIGIQKLPYKLFFRVWKLDLLAYLRSRYSRVLAVRSLPCEFAAFANR